MSEPVIIGRAKLYLGDARDVLPGIRFDHIITDPPYSDRTHASHDEQSQRRRDGADARQLGYGALSEADAASLAESAAA